MKTSVHSDILTLATRNVLQAAAHTVPPAFPRHVDFAQSILRVRHRVAFTICLNESEIVQRKRKFYLRTL